MFCSCLHSQQQASAPTASSLLNIHSLDLSVITRPTPLHKRNLRHPALQLRARLKTSRVKRHILLELHPRSVPRMQSVQTVCRIQLQSEFVSIAVYLLHGTFRRGCHRVPVSGANSEPPPALSARRAVASSQKHRQRFECANLSLCVIRLISNLHTLPL